MAHTVSLCPLKHAAVAKGHGSAQCALHVMPFTAAGMKLSLPQTLARTRARGLCIPVCQVGGTCLNMPCGPLFCLDTSKSHGPRPSVVDST